MSVDVAHFHRETGEAAVQLFSCAKMANRQQGTNSGVEILTVLSPVVEGVILDNIWAMRILIEVISILNFWTFTAISIKRIKQFARHYYSRQF